MKPSKLPTLKSERMRASLRWALTWAFLYAVAIAVVLLDCIVWRP
jgi:hypothetical protein